MIKGIDVSKWQGKIDWPKVKADGIQFAMIRVSHGAQIDPLFKANIEGAQAAGLPVGGYFYSYAQTVAEARKEAQTAISALTGYTLTYPLAFDQEDARQQKLDKRLNTDMCKAALKVVQDAGYIPALYSNPNWLRNYVHYYELQDYDLWLARWADVPGYDCAIWQYTDQGRVDGIGGNVDMNIGYKDYAPKRIMGEVLAGVNVRNAPSTSARVLRTLKAGASIGIIGTQGEWVQIGNSEYVYGAYVTTSKAKKGIVTPNRLHLREDASIKSAPLCKMPKGAALEVYDKQGDWLHVRYNGIVGYAHKDYIKL